MPRGMLTRGQQSQQAPGSKAELRAMDGAPPSGVMPYAAAALLGAAPRSASPVLLSGLSSEVVLGALTKDALHRLFEEACSPPAESGSALCTPPAEGGSGLYTPPAGSQQGLSPILNPKTITAAPTPTPSATATTAAAAPASLNPLSQHIEGWAQYYQYFHTLRADMQAPAVFSPKRQPARPPAFF